MVGDEVIEGAAPAITRSFNAGVIDLDAYNRPIICHTNNERAAVCVEKGRKCLENLALKDFFKLFLSSSIAWNRGTDGLAER